MKSQGEDKTLTVYDFFESQELTFKVSDLLNAEIQDEFIIVLNAAKASTIMARALDDLKNKGLLSAVGDDGPIIEWIYNNLATFRYIETELGVKLATKEELMAELIEK